MGRASIKALIGQLYAQYGVQDIFLSLYEENQQARRLYERFGFVPNGERDVNGEQVMVLPAPAEPAQKE